MPGRTAARDEAPAQILLGLAPQVACRRSRTTGIAGDVTPATKDGDEPHLPAGGRVRRLAVTASGPWGRARARKGAQSRRRRHAGDQGW
jgi:hypothetical protein